MAYPAQIHNNLSLPAAIDKTTPVEAAVVNRLREAILQIETALGINPAGIYSNVKNRLDMLEAMISGSPIITLGGDLSGYYPNPRVVALNGNHLSSELPSDGYILTWSDANKQWQPVPAPTGVFVASGDLSGSSFSQTVIRIQNRDVSSIAPTDGYVLTWSATNSAWEPKPATGGTGTSAGTTGTYSCDVSVSIGDVVYLLSADTVEKADADNLIIYDANIDGYVAVPLIGVVSSKPSSTQAVITYYGELNLFSSLITGATYYLSTTPGQITNTPPSTAGSIIQKIGFAKNPTTLVLMIDRDYIVVA